MSYSDISINLSETRKGQIENENYQWVLFMNIDKYQLIGSVRIGQVMLWYKNFVNYKCLIYIDVVCCQKTLLKKSLSDQGAHKLHVNMNLGGR